MNLLIRKLIKFMAYRKVLNVLPDEMYLKLLYKAHTEENLNLKNPLTFNEKLQWLKIHDRRDEYTMMVDKVKAKEYVGQILGEDKIIPTLGVWDDPDDIDFESLPNQFVLKCNHNSGLGMYICKDKTKLDIAMVKRELGRGLKENYYLSCREWPYKNVTRRILAEQYMVSDERGLIDYKIHNFNGEPKFILVCQDRFKESGLTEDFFTTDWEHMDVKRPKNKQATESISKPEELETMLRFAKILAKDIPFLRTDFYIINHKVYFSELTFYPASGLESFEPKEWDTTFGSWLSLPQ